MAVDKTPVCPECGKRLPAGSAYQRGSGIGLPDKRELDCPYCGAPLEPLRWTTLAPLFLILGVGVAAKQIFGPLLDWPVILFLLGLAALHHAFAYWNLRKARRDRSRRRLEDPDDEEPLER